RALLAADNFVPRRAMGAGVVGAPRREARPARGIRHTTAGLLHAANLRSSRNGRTRRRDRRAGGDLLALLPETQRCRQIERGAWGRLCALPHEVSSGNVFQRGVRRSPDLGASALLLADEERTGQPGE